MQEDPSIRPAASGAPSDGTGVLFSLPKGALLLVAALAGSAVFLSALGWKLRAHISGITDLTSYFLPKYQYVADRVAAGEVPLWNPFEFSGVPLLATIQPAFLYPPIRVVYAFAGGIEAWTILFVLHLSIGTLGTLALGRRLGLGLWPAVFAAQWVVQPTWIVRVWDHPVYILGAAWVPWLVLLVRAAVREPSARTAGLLGLTAAMQFLTGYPPMVLATSYVLLIAAATFVWQVRVEGEPWAVGRTAAVLAGAGLVAGLSCAGQLLPTIELSGLTNRAGEAAEVAANLPRAVALVPALGFSLGSPQPTFAAAGAEMWRLYGPVLFGLIGCGIALGWRRPVVWFGVLCAVLCAGLPFYAYKALPFYGIVRFALEWAWIAPGFVYLSAGIGLHHVASRSRPIARFAGPLTVVFLVATTLWNWRAIDLAWFESKITYRTPVPAWIEARIDLRDPNVRFFWPLGQARGSLMSQRIRSIGGYEQSLLPARNARLLQEMPIGNGSVEPTWAKEVATRASIASRMGLRWMIADRSRVLTKYGFVRHRPPTPLGQFLYENEAALPRAGVFFAAAYADSEDQALEAMYTTPLDQVILEGEPDPGLSGCGEPARAVIEEDAPEHVRVAVVSPCPGMLVLRDTLYPGWSATIDGEAVPIRVADFLYRGVSVPTGEHDVEFRYDAPHVRTGLTLSAIGLLLAVGLIVWTGRGRSASEDVGEEVGGTRQ